MKLTYHKMTRHFLKIILLISMLSLTNQSTAQNSFSLRTNYYTDNTGTSVHSPMAELRKGLTRSIEFWMRYSLDKVIVPPVRGLSAAPSVDAITGASRPVTGDDPANQTFTKNRNEINVGINLPVFAFSYYYSDEIDYLGKMVTVSTNRDFNEKNSNLAMTYSYGWDRIQPLGIDTLHSKNTHSVNATLTQVLSPKTIGRLGVDFALVQGLQSNPYRAVNAGGQILLENHPLIRTRGAVFVKMNRYFANQSSLNMEYRFYRDGWNLMSHTAGFFYHQYFSDKVLIRYRYRFYKQTGAHFHQKNYTMPQFYMTSDYKLEPFNAHLFGLKIEYKLEDLLSDGFFSFLSKSTFEAKYERYFSSNDFTADIFQFGLSFNY